MNKNILLLLIFSLALAGCGTGTVSEGSANGESSEETVNEQVKESETEIPAEETGTEKEVDNVDFNQYRSPVKTVKTFSQDEFTITHEITDQNGDYVQELVKFGDVSTLSIYEWNERGYSLVYSEENPQSQESLIEEFETVESPKEIVSISNKGEGGNLEWEMVASNEEVTVPYGSFKGVILMKKTITSETTGQKTITSRYFASEMGLIKEVTEIDGENGYTIVTELESITK
ncbi:hypothetical protein [Jeotgalibacillus proteolyticus]|uniref:hypothetical protein n=1 Tax=Jeotgalibacillus proteolyticus TaxID=2082395 RepID=UPI003CF85AA7